MKIINLETCDRSVLVELGISYEDQKVRRMSASNLRDNWTEVHADVDKQSLPKGAIILDAGAYYSHVCVGVRDGRIVSWASCAACPWWDDDISGKLVIPENGEVLTDFTIGFDSNFRPMDSWERVHIHDSLWDSVPKGCQWAGGALSPKFLHNAGAHVDATIVSNLITKSEGIYRRMRREAALERAELIYPYVGNKVFRANIQWALENEVADVAKLLAPHVRFLSSHIRPFGGWNCHKDELVKAWRRAYGWGRFDTTLDSIMNAAGRISQPRFSAAWEVAKVISAT